jgi:cell division protein FtsW (lipid II flippase)
LALTRSSATERTRTSFGPLRRDRWPFSYFLWVVAAGLLIGAGLYLVYQAKAQGFAEIRQGVAVKQILDLNDLSARDDLLPVLTMFPDLPERQFVARKIYYISGGLANVGALARIRVPESEIRRTRGLTGFRERLEKLPPPGDRERSLPLLTSEQFRLLKPHFIVRRPEVFERDLLLWAGLYFAAFLAVAIWWRIGGFRGDRAMLIPIFLLTGAGFILMISLRDPVRDQMIFTGFAQGAIGGCAILAVASFIDFRRIFGKLSFVPLVASFALSALLILFGHGPGTSDAKVNLFGFQPVEVIRVLLVLFLAGYFAERWDVLRHARETRPRIAWLARHVDVPPLEYVIPVLVCVALSLLFFFLQKDLGPALIFTCLFLVLYAIARRGALMIAAGLGTLVAGFACGYFLGVPHTVSERVMMWLAPWNNTVHGGDQLAQSLWAYSSGGAFGAGLGLGDPAVVPAAHTDLILSALGEEWGFLGVIAVFGLYAILMWRALRIALRAASDYEFFLAAGLATAVGLQVLLIGAGSLGVSPLSGVVTPFLSYGRTSLLCTFLMFAMLLSISRQPADAERNGPFRAPVRALGVALGGLAVIVAAKAAYVQVARDAATMGAGTLVTQADGARRYEYNPRFQDIMREIPKGDIFDRNDLPLATSRWEDLEAHRADYAKLAIDLDRACSRTENRHYPFAGLTFDLLGDLRTRARWGAPNTSFVERDYATRLRGFDDRPTIVEVKNPSIGSMDRIVRYDYRELVPLLRHRYDPQNPAVRRILDRPRDLHMTIDARLQVRLAQILKEKLRQAGRDKGAIVVLDPATGDLLAAVSAPQPDASEESERADLDRARYGLYPPGSTFKIVTAMAALRKDPSLTRQQYSCIRLPDGRVGNYIRGSNRPIRDDVQDTVPHGTLDMERGIVVSCNAYFAQLAAYNIGAGPMGETSRLLGISMGRFLPQSAYGQGQVVASPLQMARVAATVANSGQMAQVRAVTDVPGSDAKAVLSPELSATLGKFMREVVTGGTGKRAAAAAVPVAGKTGTAELAGAPSHAWFIGFAPYGNAPHRIAFSILIENGQYGGTWPAAAAVDIVAAARDLGYLGKP